MADGTTQFIRSIGQQLSPQNVVSAIETINRGRQQERQQRIFAESMNNFNQEISRDPEFAKIAKSVGKFHPGFQQSPERFARFRANVEAHRSNIETLNVLREKGLIDPDGGDEVFNALTKKSMLNPDATSGQLVTLTSSLLQKRRDDARLGTVLNAVDQAFQQPNLQSGLSFLKQTLKDPRALQAAQDEFLRRFSQRQVIEQRGAVAAARGVTTTAKAVEQLTEEQIKQQSFDRIIQDLDLAEDATLQEVQQAVTDGIEDKTFEKAGITPDEFLQRFNLRQQQLGLTAEQQRITRLVGGEIVRDFADRGVILTEGTGTAARQIGTPSGRFLNAIELTNTAAQKAFPDAAQKSFFGGFTGLPVIQNRFIVDVPDLGIVTAIEDERGNVFAFQFDQPNSKGRIFRLVPAQVQAEGQTLNILRPQLDQQNQLVEITQVELQNVAEDILSRGVEDERPLALIVDSFKDFENFVKKQPDVFKTEVRRVGRAARVLKTTDEIDLTKPMGALLQEIRNSRAIFEEITQIRGRQLLRTKRAALKEDDLRLAAQTLARLMRLRQRLDAIQRNAFSAR